MAANASPSCPRCGYDLSGEVATWTETCPLTGICPECGFRIDWGRNMARHASGWWLFELDVASRRKAFTQTFLRALRPRSFWSSVRVEDAPNLRRLSLFLCLVVLLVHVMIAVPAGLAAAKRIWGPLIPASWRAPAPPPTTTPTVPPPPTILYLTNTPTDWERFQNATGLGFWAALSPYTTLTQKWGAVIHVPRLGPSFMSGVAAMCLLPFTLAAARGIFREGRAKAAHFWRAWVYGWVGSLLLVVLSALASTLIVDPNDLLPQREIGVLVTPDPTFWLAPAMFAWAVYWWHAAASRYLQWERPLSVSLSACIAAFGIVFGLMQLWRGWDFIRAM
jgi:hypothetical protein